MALFKASGRNNVMLDRQTKEVFMYLNVDDEDMREYLKEEFGDDFEPVSRGVHFDIDPDFVSFLKNFKKGGKK